MKKPALARARRCFSCAAIGAMLSIGCMVGHAQLFVDLSDFSLSANTADQEVDIFLRNAGSSTVSSSGIDFYAMITDTGTQNLNGPAISSVDLSSPSSGTVYSGRSDPTTAGDTSSSYKQYWFTGVTDPVNNPAPLQPGSNNKIAVLKLSTAGLSSGTFDFRLDWGFSANPQKTTIYDENGDPLALTINYPHGPQAGFTTGSATLTITPVPEPSQYAAVLGLGCLAWAFVSRKLKRAAV